MNSISIPKEKIYVVGFPKSGNTWLTRLLADVLLCPAGHGVKDDDSLEIASDLNEEILQINKNPQYKVVKTHNLPHILFESVKQPVSRVVYINRDIRDVVISAFFAKNKFSQMNEENVSTKKLKDCFRLIPINLMKHFYYRYKLNKHVHEILQSWPNVERIGSWGQHISAWRNVAGGNINMSFITYEDLLRDTTGSVKRIIKDLGLEEISENRLKEAVERQSFKNKKNYFKNLKSSDSVPKGQYFNYKFLRKGKAGDWKKYFTPRMAQKVNKFQGQGLIENKYEDNLNWYENF